VEQKIRGNGTISTGRFNGKSALRPQPRTPFNPDPRDHVNGEPTSRYKHKPWPLKRKSS